MESPRSGPDDPAAEPPLVPVAVEQFVAAAAMAAICLITFANVVVRYVTDYSFAFTEEYSVFLLVVLTLAGSAAGFATDRHIRITFLVDRLGPSMAHRVELVVTLLSALLFGLLVWYGSRMAWDDWRFEVTSSGLGVPQWWYTVALPVLSAAILARLLGRLVRLLRAAGGGRR